ncbi:hypothetical protein CDL12_05634 [Handroanthus impetiginosus]|uniref:S-type anion channel SLAH2-like n=1 Tax=Handroanthus impetiginosus TaxID=429701 RepID=A0A2G9HVY0_9LAMI|nr:hypothetical protein CDL12_05634 [Handroanthus impetiginosus]
MENRKGNHLAKEEAHDVIPSLIKSISAHEVAGFDFDHDDSSRQLKTILAFPQAIELADGKENDNDLSEPQRKHSLSISMPPSPVEAHLQNKNRVFFADGAYENDGVKTKQAIFYSQPMPKGSALNQAITNGNFDNPPVMNPRIHKLQDKRFDSFKTWSGKLERQLSNLRGKHCENEQEPHIQRHAEFERLPVERYFDALEGPELDTLRASEEILLPEDKKWPFLLRFPITSFGICLGVSSQAIMWKTLASSASTKFLHMSPDINLVLWIISVAVFLIVALIYALKIIFYFEAVRREYYHPIRVSFFFAPWITLLFLAIGVPKAVSQTLHASLWYILMTPLFCLELKIYGQWMSGGQRRLSKVANPSNHLSVVGNFVGALLGASMGLKEGPIFFFAVGLAHYLVLFVTLYQRLPTNATLPKELHPVFFLFVAAPSIASMAWARIQGSFDYGSRIAYFIALFLYFSLAVRVNFFRGFRFSLAWWAYTFPMTGAAIATIRYTDVVTNVVTKTLTVILSIAATLTVSALLVTTIVHAFILRDLFPNDIAIAISDRKPKSTRKWYHMRTGSSDNNIEKYLKYSSSDGKDIEASISPPSSKDGEMQQTNKDQEP